MQIQETVYQFSTQNQLAFMTLVNPAFIGGESKILYSTFKKLVKLNLYWRT